MKFLKFKVFIILLISISLNFTNINASYAQDINYTYYILVEDQYGSPISNVLVRVESYWRRHDKGSKYTDSNGLVCFSVNANRAQRRVSVAATLTREGYSSNKKNLSIHTNGQREIIRMFPDPRHQKNTQTYVPTYVEPAYTSPPPTNMEPQKPKKNFEEMVITGTLTIITDPLGATIYIDDEKAEKKTPLKIKIQAGSHVVGIKYKNISIEKTVDVPMEDKYVLRVDLKKELEEKKAEQRRQEEIENQARLKRENELRILEQKRINFENKLKEREIATISDIKYDWGFFIANLLDGKNLKYGQKLELRNKDGDFFNVKIEKISQRRFSASVDENLRNLNIGMMIYSSE